MWERFDNIALRTWVGSVALLFLNAPAVQGQLAITEVMADAYYDPANPEKFPGPDYFEITNFGDSPIDLTGYKFGDSDSIVGEVGAPFLGDLIIDPNESIILFEIDNRTSATNAAQFCQWWWGETDHPECPRVFAYDGPGFNGDIGDEVWLYDPFDNVVDMVAFGESSLGRSFVYDGDTGIFGERCSPTKDDCIKAAQANDYGSPGTTTGRILLAVIEAPMDQEVDAGSDAEFSIVASGMPQPKYQWTKDGFNIPGATQRTLIIPNAQPSDAGQYCVYLDNGFESLLSECGELTINTNPAPPSIIASPADQLVFVGQCAVFTVKARGYPALQYQWKANGDPIPSETDLTLTLTGVTLAMSGTDYSVCIWNELGTNEVSARLTVTKRPKLRISEIMTFPIDSLNSLHEDWFELENLDNFEVDLQGYRFKDTDNMEEAFEIEDPVTIHPGETVIFVKEMTPENFRRWWGEDNLPPDLQIITFRGFGFSSGGEELYLWNSAAKELDTVASTTFYAALEGVSFEFESDCDESYGCITFSVFDSVAGERGAFRATELGDIGSPGYTSNPIPRIARILPGPDGATLNCRVVEGRSYRLHYTDALDAAMTSMPTTYNATDSILTIIDSGSAGLLQRYYMLEELP